MPKVIMTNHMPLKVQIFVAYLNEGPHLNEGLLFHIVIYLKNKLLETEHEDKQI